MNKIRSKFPRGRGVESEIPLTAAARTSPKETIASFDNWDDNWDDEKK